MRRIRPASWKLHGTIGQRGSFWVKATQATSYLLFSPVSLTQRWQSRKEFLLVLKRVGQHHEKSTDNTQVTKEEREIEQETVSEA